MSSEHEDILETLNLIESKIDDVNHRFDKIEDIISNLKE